MRRCGLASPDDADALALTFADPVVRRDPAEERRYEEGDTPVEEQDCVRTTLIMTIVLTEFVGSTESSIGAELYVDAKRIGCHGRARC